MSGLWLALATAGVLTVALVLGSAAWFDSVSRPRPVGLAEIMYFTDVSLPNSAVVVRSELTEFPHPLLLARLDLPRRDMDSVRNTPTLKGKWSQGAPSTLEALFLRRGYWEQLPPGAKAWYASGPVPRRHRRSPRQALQVVDVILIEWDRNTAVVYVYAAGN